MAEDNLQYTVTFKTRAEGDGAQKVVAAVRDLKAEQERLTALRSPEHTRRSIGAEYDLARAIEETERATRKAAFATNEDAFAKVRARQAAEALIEDLKREELAKKKAAAASNTMAAGNRRAASAVQNTSFQVQDLATQLAAGTSAATAFGQQLPQLLGGFGMWGAIAGGVVALGALVLKLNSAKEGTQEFNEAADELKRKLEELQDTRAQEFVDAYAHSMEMLKQQTEDLREAEVRRIDTQARVAEAQRGVQEQQDKATASILDYMEAVLGLDVTQQRAALAQRENQRAAESATASATAELNKQKEAYDNVLTSIAEMNRELDDAAAKREELSQQESDLNKQIRFAGLAGKSGLEGDLQQKLAEVMKLAGYYDEILRETPKTIERLYVEGYRLAGEIDAQQATTAAELEKINATLEASNRSDEIKGLIAQNQKITGDLSAALDDVKVTTPAQAQAAADMAAALADGKLTAQELQALSGQIRTLGPEFTAAVNGNTALVEKLLGTIKELAAKQRSLESQVEGLRNGIK